MKCIIFPMGYIVLNIICNSVQFINVRITKIGKIHLIRMVLSNCLRSIWSVSHTVKRQPISRISI